MISVLRSRFGLIYSAAIAAVIHVFAANVFVFTFPEMGSSTKPVFVFLGSFLRPEDVSLSAAENSFRRENMNARNFNLDIRAGSLPREFDKPDLAKKVGQPAKQQYKPVMKEEGGVVKPKTTADDLGVDLAPFEPVRMRMDRSDPSDQN